MGEQGVDTRICAILTAATGLGDPEMGVAHRVAPYTTESHKVTVDICVSHKDTVEFCRSHRVTGSFSSEVMQ